MTLSMTNFTLFFPLSKNPRFILIDKDVRHISKYITSKTVLGSLSKLMIHLLPTQPKLYAVIINTNDLHTFQLSMNGTWQKINTTHRLR